MARCSVLVAILVLSNFVNCHPPGAPDGPPIIGDDQMPPVTQHAENEEDTQMVEPNYAKPPPLLDQDASPLDQGRSENRVLDTNGAPGADIGGGLDIAPMTEDEMAGQEPPPVLINNEGNLNCVRSPEPMDAWYPTCQVRELMPHCYEIVCPENYKECSGQDGKRYKMGDPEWRETETASGKISSCSCDHPSSVYWSMPPTPIGAPDYPPIKNCVLEGCENSFDNGAFLRPGELIKSDDGTQCMCVRGQDPSLADANTRYYLHCGIPQFGAVPHEPEPDHEADGALQPPRVVPELELNEAEQPPPPETLM